MNTEPRFYPRFARGKQGITPRIISIALVSLIALSTTSGSAVGDHVKAAPAAGMFLVAAPSMRDPRFSKTVVLLVEHSVEGTLGVIINKRTDVPVTDAFPDLNQENVDGHVLFFGGPVEPASVMYLYSNGEGSTGQEIVSGVRLGASFEDLERLLMNQDENSLRIFFGYSGWGPGQLEFELSLDDWQLFPASSDHIFTKDTNQLWHLLNRHPPGMMAGGESLRLFATGGRIY